jgi:hypothetical protein
MNSKYDDAKVEALLNLLGKDFTIFSVELSEAIAALRPKPTKFYIMPTWDDFCVGKQVVEGGEIVAFMTTDSIGVSFGGSIYNAIREITASDKPLVHIPAGSEWNNDDLRQISYSTPDSANAAWSGIRAFVDAIKAKLESKA